MTAYFDYNFRFPIAGLPLALTAMLGLQAYGLLDAGDIPPNMLGDPRDQDGNIVASAPAFVGRPGTAASSYVDMNGTTVTIPAKGDLGFYYIAIRAMVDPTTLPFDPTVFGLTPSDPDESAAVLGVWS
jgi:hypothetical protein